MAITVDGACCFEIRGFNDTRLREYVIDDIYYGYSIKECCERYDISRSEVREIIRRDQEGNY